MAYRGLRAWRLLKGRMNVDPVPAISFFMQEVVIQKTCKRTGKLLEFKSISFCNVSLVLRIK